MKIANDIPIGHSRRLSPTFLIGDLIGDLIGNPVSLKMYLVFVVVAAPSHGAIARRLWAWLRPGPETGLGGEDCLSKASSAALEIGTGAKAPPWATPGRQWFWVLLPKQKDLVVRGRNPA